MNKYSATSSALAQLASLYAQLAKAYKASDQRTIEQAKLQIEKLEQVYQEIKRTK